MSLNFGTGGVREIMGDEPHQMNEETIRRLTIAVSSVWNRKNDNSVAKKKRAVICYDSRNNSSSFARCAAFWLKERGFFVYLGEEPLPTPFLSFCIRDLKADLGINITASHNPKEYNGYKVFGSDGAQIDQKTAEQIIDALMTENDIKNDFISQGKILSLPGKLKEKYKKTILFYCDKGEEEGTDTSLKIVYSPLHGTGASFLPEVIRSLRGMELILVKEQEKPDGNFPTCLVPNPEEKEALQYGIDYGRRAKADLVLATDPDSDRVGAAVAHEGEFIVLSGNEMGILLLDYLLAKSQKDKKVIITTVVTTSLTKKIAKYYGAKTVLTLTGFKYIGEEIGRMEKEGREQEFLLGLEESCGYLIGTYARDKDGISAAMRIAEMTKYYKRKGKTLVDRLNELYELHGKVENILMTRKISEKESFSYMEKLRNKIKHKGEWEGQKVIKVTDYKKGRTHFPPSDMITLFLEEGKKVTIRPSGTEQKIKIYEERRRQ